MSKMDYNKIFIEEACPTSIGGQAVMEGVMMQGPDRMALAVRIPSGKLYLKTRKKARLEKYKNMPVIRGIVAFALSLVNGMSTLMESADILEKYAPEEYSEEPGRLEAWINKKFGDKAAWNFMMTSALILAIVISVVFFVILPTWIVNVFSKWITSSIILNLIEGLLRIAMFIGYVAAIRRMEDIMTLFRYHGAEHKSIHCFENGLELTPENAEQFYTLHPRCGTSFIVFVLIISILLFSFCGWPNLLWRIVSRLLLIPVVAGLSYELLKWAGRSNGAVVKALSWPGLMLQKLTTAEPTREQLEVALLSLKAVLVDPETPEIDGFVDADGNLLEEEDSADEEAPAEDETEAEKVKAEEKTEEPAAEDVDAEPVEEADETEAAEAAEESGEAEAAEETAEDAEEEAAEDAEEERAEEAAEAAEKTAEYEAGELIAPKEEGMMGISAAEALASIQQVAADVRAGAANMLNEIRNKLAARLNLEVKPKEEDAPDPGWDELWEELNGPMSKKLPDDDVIEPADDSAINEAILFLNELDKDGYTLVAREDCDGRTLLQGIAEQFQEDAKARTLAKRYTNDITTIENALKWGQAALSMIENGRNEARMILSYATGLTHSEIITRSKELMKDDDFEVFEKRIHDRLTGTPLQYILGIQEFMGLPFRVNPSVLIPRLDTEVLVTQCLKMIDEKGWTHPEVLDMCTGSGAIGISIAAKMPGALVTMTDISSDALRTAMVNADLNNVSKQCIFLEGDMFDALPEDKQFDMIVINPPYIESKVIPTLDIEVRDHEPRLALDGGEDGLDYYRVIAEHAGAHLRSGGILALEIGADQAVAVKRLLNKARSFDNMHKVRDLAGLDRVIVAERL